MTDWNRVWQETAPRLHSWLKSRAADVADDVLQESFMRAISAERKSTNMQNPAAYLFRIARNLMMDHARISAKVQTFPEIEIAAPDADIYSDLLPALREAILNLPDEDRELMELYLSGLSQKEISLVLSVTDRTVRRRYESIRSELRRALEAADVL